MPPSSLVLVPGTPARPDTPARPGRRRVLLMAAALPLAGCGQDAPPPAPEVRPVRFVRAERRVLEDDVSLTGQIHAREEISLAFRTGGRVVERRVQVGNRVVSGQPVARLDSIVQANAVTSAEANLSASRSQFAQLGPAFERQRSLLASGFATRAQFDLAQQQLQTARSQVEAAEAGLRTAREQLSYTDLVADAAGTVTATGAEPGEVVAAGQMVVQVAGQDGRDAVFEVPASLLRAAPRDPLVAVALTDNPAVAAAGRVREVAPQANPVTRTFQVKVALADPPVSMRLGATVTGTVRLGADAEIAVPASALTRAEERPAVWVVEEPAMTVALRPIAVRRYEPAGVVVSQGLQPGEAVVTAGAQALRPGQAVRLLEDGR